MTKPLCGYEGCGQDETAFIHQMHCSFGHPFQPLPEETIIEALRNALTAGRCLTNLPEESLPELQPRKFLCVAYGIERDYSHCKFKIALVEGGNIIGTPLDAEPTLAAYAEHVNKELRAELETSNLGLTVANQMLKETAMERDVECDRAEAAEAERDTLRKSLGELNAIQISREVHAKYGARCPTPDQAIVFTLCKVEKLLAPRPVATKEKA